LVEYLNKIRIELNFKNMISELKLNRFLKLLEKKIKIKDLKNRHDIKKIKIVQCFLIILIQINQYLIDNKNAQRTFIKIV
jgi:hypothetical protein